MVPRLHNSPSIYSYTIGVLFNGMLTELPAILEFFHQYHSDYMGLIGWQWWRATKW